MVLSIVARLLSALVSVYMLLCSIRILMSWVPGMDTGRGGDLLRRGVDPYLGFFSRFKVLNAGKFDFSPIAALAVLAVANDLLTTLAFTGSLSLALVLGMVLSAVWSALAFILSFFAVCALVRIIAYAARWNSLHPIWRVIDSLLNPLLYRINRILYRGRIVNYLQGLATGFGVLILARFAGGLLIAFLVRLIERIPL